MVVIHLGNMQKVKIIAEIGINHSGKLENAKKLIQAAKDSGCDYGKLQTYITEKRVKLDSPIFDILKKCELSFSEQEKLFKFSKEIDFEIFSTPFDNESVNFLESVGCQILKIASFDSINKELLTKVSKTKKQSIISTGMTNESELNEAISILENSNFKPIILHCISSYPLHENNALLSNIRYLKKKYPKNSIGFSDHSVGIKVPILAAAAGAEVIEKHFTIDDIDEGPDNSISLNKIGMTELVNEIKKLETIFGNPALGIRDSENEIVQYRRNRIL